MTTYGVAMTTAQKPTELGASIIEAMKLANVNQTEVHTALGISYNTWRKRLASDGFTIQDLIRISNITGISLGAIIPRHFLGSAAA